MKKREPLPEDAPEGSKVEVLTYAGAVRKTRAYLDLMLQNGEEFLPRPEVAVTQHAMVSQRDELMAFREKVLPCVQCPQLAKMRKHVVFGSGNPHAGLVFVGEAPGAEEDRQGLPFVGEAGQLLTKIILAMKLRREDVFICNVLKCRPPQNRNPLPDEIRNCEPYLIRQLEIIRPKVICALGNFAAQTLLRTDRSISSLRGHFFDYHGIKVMPTYHPAYLLRNPADKKLVWADMQLVMRELGIQ